MLLKMALRPKCLLLVLKFYHELSLKSNSYETKGKRQAE